MRTCLGFQFLNESAWLKLHLPVILRYPFDGVVAIDGGSTDDSVFAIKHACGRAARKLYLGQRPWDWHFDLQQNAVVERAEAEGFDALLKWDPDELLYPGHIEQAFDLLKDGAKAIKVNRINFEDDRRHYAPYDYPDMQLRFHVLNEGWRWVGRLHAGPNVWTFWHEHPNSDPHAPRDIIWCPHINIYHYEGIKPRRERVLKQQNYQRIKDGLDPWTALPDTVAVTDGPVRFIVRYDGPQPLDPFTCGVRAPY